jgi:phenylacetaldehyde dehydrogenase
MIGTRRAPAARAQESVNMATVQPLKSSIDRQPEQLMLIDGERVRAVSGNTINVFDPSTGRLIGTVPDGAQADIERAVAAASRAFRSPEWSGLSGQARARILWRMADLMEQNIEELANLEALNSGMIVPMAQGMVQFSAELFRYFAGWCTKIYGLTAEIGAAPSQFHAYTLREPVGVCGFILPWNVPISATCLKLAPALAAGCTAVIKPAEETPLTALRLGELMHEAGVPAGVINIVTGFGHTAGAALAANENVAKIAFTGSTEVGKLIVQAAAGNLKKVTLELGGKSPVVVFADCDLERTIAGVAGGVFTHAGQLCIAGSRLLVERKSFDQVVSGLAGAAKSLKIGGAFDPQTQVGPLISEKQLQRVTGLIQSGAEEGAEVVTGGKRCGTGGYFVEPTVLANPRTDARVLKEEIFGPVITALPFDDIEEVTQEANRTEYGLAAAVWTRDLNKAHTMARRIQSGIVWINCQLMADPSLPLGGYKQSGWGRECGPEGLDAYLQSKAVIAMVS